MSKRKKYFIVYLCDDNNGRLAIGTTFIKLNHKIKTQKDVLEIKDGIEKNTDCKNVNIINWKELDDE